MNTRSFRSRCRDAERQIAFGGVELLQKPRLAGLIVAVGITTDFFAFYASFSAVYDFFNALIVSACAAAMIDTLPLVSARCVNDLRGGALTDRERRWSTVTLGVSVAVFLALFAASAYVRWSNGAALFSADLISSAETGAALTPADLSASQRAMLLFLCALPLFTSLAVFLVGLFSDGKAQRRMRLRMQRSALTESRAQLSARKQELETALGQDRDLESRLLCENMQNALDTAAGLMIVLYQTALAEKLGTPDDLSHLARRSGQLLQTRDPLIRLSDIDRETPVAIANKH